MSDDEQAAAGDRKHLLTVAVEDYFHGSALNPLVPEHQWGRFESRVPANTRRALDLLDEHGAKATFFVLGWIADQVPEVVREIVDRGHEVASKGYLRRPLQQMTRREFRDDLLRARDTLERAGGRAVVGHRVAQDSIGLDDLWALDTLAANGFVYDSSMYPRFRSIASQPWRRFPHVHRSGDLELHELPLSTWGSNEWLLPAAGGNVFRQLPETLMRRLVASWDRTYDAPFNMHFHVWELDPELPRITAAGWLARVRQYRNLLRMPDVLRYYLQTYRFQSISSYLELDPKRPPRVTAQKSRVVAPAAPVSSPDAAERETITIVIPCFNEELVLPYLSNTLRDLEQALGTSYELRFVMVDDGSSDRTWEDLDRLFGSRPEFELIRHERNQGVAAAILTGIRHAQTDVVSSIDCDCTYDPRQLSAMLPLLKDDVAMVTASPYHPLGGVRGVPQWRLFLSRSLSGLYRRVLRTQLATYTSCFRVYRRERVSSLQPKDGGFLGVTEMLVLADQSGEHVLECPAVLEVRMLGHSKMKTLSTIAQHLGLLGRVVAGRFLRAEARADG